MPKVEDDEMFEDDRDDADEIFEEDAEAESEEEELEEVPVAKKKASNSGKAASKKVEEEVTSSKKAASKPVKKAKAGDEDAEEHPKSKGKEVKKMAKKEKTHRSTKRGPVLAGYFSQPKTLRATYHGKELKATVQPDGTIKFNGETFTSPSGAGSSIRNGKSKVDGWHFWKIENKKGELVTLDSLRQKKSA